MASSGRYSDGTLLRAPKGNLAIVAGGKLRAVQDRRLLEDEDFTPTDPVDVEQAEFDSLPQAAPLTAPNWTWDTGLVGVRPGETGHVASSRGRLTVATGHIVGENRAVAYTLLGGFHVSFSVIVHDAEGFPLPSSIGMPIQRIGVDGRWIGVNDRTVPWQYQ
ncbi:MAG: hypothetical protein ACRDI2_21670, partial [Chloroflexota bacterium]